MNHTRNRARLGIAGTATMIALLSGCAGVSMVPAGRLTPVKDRVTDEAIARDLAVFDALDRRLTSAAPSPTGADRYVASRASEYVRIAREAYERNDRSSFVDDAIQWATADIETLEQGRSSAAMSSVVPMPKGTTKVGDALWLRADSLRRMGGALSTSGELAKAEAALVRAGHPFLAGPACVDEAPLAAAERLLADASKGAGAILAPGVPGAPRDTTPSSGVAREQPLKPTPVEPPPAAVKPTPSSTSKKDEVPERLAGVPTIVHFALDKSYLAETTKEVLDALIAKVAPYSGIHIVLSGHTDIRASDEYNQALSERRVSSVRKYLLSKGLPDARLTVKAFGERQVLVPGQKIMDHARNRRVAISYVLSDGTDVEPVEQLSDIQLEAARRKAAAKQD
ncbi:MAG: OmpA family protein [Gemmatimonadaceae bacterium]